MYKAHGKFDEQPVTDAQSTQTGQFQRGDDDSQPAHGPESRYSTRRDLIMMNIQVEVERDEPDFKLLRHPQDAMATDVPCSQPSTLGRAAKTWLLAGRRDQ